MTYTTAETLSVNGVILNTLAKNIEELTGRLRTPKSTTDNAQVPKRHGRVRVGQKFYEQNELALPMWVVGSNDDGTIPVGSTEAKTFWTNIDILTSLFSLKSSALDVRHTLPDGSVRQCYADVLETIDFEVSMKNLGRFTVVLTVPDAFWQDVYASTQVISGLSALPVTSILSTFAGATAPMEDMAFTFTGPITNPEVWAYANSQPLPLPIWFRYNGIVPAGQTLSLDCSTWTIGGSMAPVYANLVHLGSARWMSVQAATDAGNPQIQVRGSGTTTATRLEVMGRRKFLVG